MSKADLNQLHAYGYALYSGASRCALTKDRESVTSLVQRRGRGGCSDQ
jgi:hypothetical protein